MSGLVSRPRAALVVELLPYVMVIGLVGVSAGYVVGTAASEPTVDDDIASDDDPWSATAPPIATFEFTPVEPSVGDVVTFDASDSIDPDGQIVRYLWDFDGDGAFDLDTTAPRANTSYSEAGSYSLWLMVLDDEGNSDEVFARIRVIGIDSPTARIDFAPANPLVDEVVTFDASSSTDPDGGIVRYVWDFDGDDRNDAIGKRVNHTFRTRGDKTVSLTVTDNDGNRDQREALVPVVESIPPTVQFFYTPDNPTVRESIAFDASESFDPNGRIVRYAWDFDGDGTIELGTTAPRATHTYDQAGTYTVTLAITDDQGLVERAEQTILITPEPVAVRVLSITSSVILVAILVAVIVTFRRLASRRSE